MKKHIIVSTLIATSLAGVAMPAFAQQLPSRADVLSYRQYAGGSVRFGVTGGQLYRVQLRASLPLKRIEVQANSGALRLVEAILVFEGGQRMRIQELSNTPFFQGGQMAVSESLIASLRVSAVEILAEGAADISVVAYSAVTTPQLMVGVIGGAPQTDAVACGPEYSNLAAQLEQLDTDMQTWEQRYQQAPANSATEALAKSQLQQTADRMAQLAISAEMTSLNLTTLENLGKKYEEKYQRARSNSILEATYLKVTRSAYDKMLEAFDRQIGCTQTVQAMLDLAVSFNGKYQKAASNSKAEAIYLALTKKSYDAVAGIYKNEASRKDFRALENDGLRFGELYQKAQANSKAESTYLALSKEAFKASEDKLRVTKMYLSPDQLFALLQEYETKYQQAPSNSLMESHCRNIKAIITQ